MSQNVNGRSSALAQICRIAKYSKNIPDNADVTDLDAYLDLLQATWTKFNEHHEAVLAVTGPSAIDTQLVLLEPAETAYIKALAALRRARQDIADASQVTDSPTISNSSRPTSSQVELKPLECPIFSSGYVEWQSFCDMFLAIVHSSPKYTNVEKLHYLRSYVSGEAAGLIAHIPLTNNNYEIAWTTLKNRYTNRRVVLNALLDQLFDQPTAKETAASIKSLLDTTTQTISMLENSHRPVEHWDDIIVYAMARKLPTESRRLWETKASSSAIPSTWGQFSEFLLNRFRTLESIPSTEIAKPRSTARIHNATQSTPNVGTRPDHTATPSKQSVKPKYKCTLCGASHSMRLCTEFLNADPTKRRQLAIQHGLCCNCLGHSHATSQCSSKFRCFKCNGSHHTLLHTNQSAVDSSPTPTVSAVSTVVAATTAPLPTQTTVVLPTAQVTATDVNGTTHQLCALIDQGSQISLITERAAQLLRIKRTNHNTIVAPVGDSPSMRTRGCVTVRLASVRDPTIGVTVDAYVLHTITSLLPSHEITSVLPSDMHHLPFADPNWHTPKPIDLLIGAATFCQIIECGLVRLTNNMIAQNTIFGWIISGRRESNHELQMSSVNTVMSNDSISETLKQFWDIALDDQPIHHSIEDEAVERHYAETHSRLPDGRYQVRLPFRTLLPNHQPVALGESLPNALAQLRRVHRRMRYQPEFQRLYCDFMAQYLQLGHMELIPPSEINGQQPCYYLPHHAVLKESSSSTNAYSAHQPTRCIRCQPKDEHRYVLKRLIINRSQITARFDKNDHTLAPTSHRILR